MTKTASRAEWPFPPHSARPPRSGSAAFWAVQLAGAAGFAWPLVFAARPSSETHAHATDAPLLLVAAVPLLVLVALGEARRGGDARLVALLGALTAVNAVLRIPKGPAGEGLVFVLPVLAGWSLGGRFGFLLGAFSMLASAVLTGGVGPWLPFQMFALGWVGLGAGGVRALLRGRGEVPVLTAYAVASSLGYGFVMTLWFWPFLASGSGGLLFDPSLGPLAALGRFCRYYALTSLPWDSARALLQNAPLVALLARPVGVLLRRARERFCPLVAPLSAPGEAPAPAPGGEAAWARSSLPPA